jgi:hypothetical protein
LIWVIGVSGCRSSLWLLSNIWIWTRNCWNRLLLRSLLRGYLHFLSFPKRFRFYLNLFLLELFSFCHHWLWLLIIEFGWLWN